MYEQTRIDYKLGIKGLGRMANGKASWKLLVISRK
jgi:hypothetical protein